MTSTISRGLAALLLAAAGCGGDHMTGPDPGAFSAAASDVSATAERHRQDMGAAGVSGCSAEMSRYGAAMRPLVGRMDDMSGDMDACMTAMGHPESADMRSTCDQMRAELEAHLAGGCSAADPAAEAARHAGAMQQLASHEMQRAGSMGGMMGSRADMMGGGCGR